MMLTPAGYGDRVEEINKVAVDAALRARDRAPDGRHVAVGGCLSHMVPHIAGTDLVDPERTPGPAEMSEAFHELAGLLKSGGVDHIMLEIMYEPTRTPLALEAALSTGLPVWFGLSSRFDANNKVVSFNLADDISLQPIIDGIPERGVDVVNIMHTQSNVVADTIDLVRTKFSGPIGVYPDSGYFEMPNWNFSEVIEPTRLKQFYSQWLDKEVQLIGGCCGLTVEHIEAANAARNERR